MPVTLDTAFFDDARVFKPLLPQPADQFVLGDKFFFEVRPVEQTLTPAFFGTSRGCDKTHFQDVALIGRRQILLANIGR